MGSAGCSVLPKSAHLRHLRGVEINAMPASFVRRACACAIAALCFGGRHATLEVSAANHSSQPKPPFHLSDASCEVSPFGNPPSTNEFNINCPSNVQQFNILFDLQTYLVFVEDEQEPLKGPAVAQAHRLTKPVNFKLCTIVNHDKLDDEANRSDCSSLTLEVTRTADHNPRLTSLRFTHFNKNLEPPFDPDVLDYHVTLYAGEPVGVLAKTGQDFYIDFLEPLPESRAVLHEASKIYRPPYENGTDVDVVVLYVAAEDRYNFVQYRINVTTVLSINPRLASIDSDVGRLEPRFMPSDNVYYLFLPVGSDMEPNVEFAAINDRDTNIHLDKKLIGTGRATATIPVPEPGSTQIHVVQCVANNPEYMIHYVLIVAPEVHGGTGLLLMQPTAGQLFPRFSRRRFEYSLHVPHEQRFTALKLIPANPRSHITVNGAPICAKTGMSAWTPVQLGDASTFQVLVKDAPENPIPHEYNITVTRQVRSKLGGFVLGNWVAPYAASLVEFYVGTVGFFNVKAFWLNVKLSQFISASSFYERNPDLYSGFSSFFHSFNYFSPAVDETGAAVGPAAAALASCDAHGLEIFGDDRTPLPDVLNDFHPIRVPVPPEALLEGDNRDGHSTGGIHHSSSGLHDDSGSGSVASGHPPVLAVARRLLPLPGQPMDAQEHWRSQMDDYQAVAGAAVRHSRNEYNFTYGFLNSMLWMAGLLLLYSTVYLACLVRYPSNKKADLVSGYLLPEEEEAAVATGGASPQGEGSAKEKGSRGSSKRGSAVGGDDEDNNELLLPAQAAGSLGGQQQPGGGASSSSSLAAAKKSATMRAGPVRLKKASPPFFDPFSFLGGVFEASLICTAIACTGLIYYHRDNDVAFELCFGFSLQPRLLLIPAAVILGLHQLGFLLSIAYFSIRAYNGVSFNADLQHWTDRECGAVNARESFIKKMPGLDNMICTDVRAVSPVCQIQAAFSRTLYAPQEDDGSRLVSDWQRVTSGVPLNMETPRLPAGPWMEADPRNLPPSFHYDALPTATTHQQQQQHDNDVEARTPRTQKEFEMQERRREAADASLVKGGSNAAALKPATQVGKEEAGEDDDTPPHGALFMTGPGGYACDFERKRILVGTDPELFQTHMFNRQNHYAYSDFPTAVVGYKRFYMRNPYGFVLPIDTPIKLQHLAAMQQTDQHANLWVPTPHLNMPWWSRMHTVFDSHFANPSMYFGVLVDRLVMALVCVSIVLCEGLGWICPVACGSAFLLLGACYVPGAIRAANERWHRAMSQAATQLDLQKQWNEAIASGVRRWPFENEDLVTRLLGLKNAKEGRRWFGLRGLFARLGLVEPVALCPAPLNSGASRLFFTFRELVTGAFASNLARATVLFLIPLGMDGGALARGCGCRWPRPSP
eukprot:GHVU01102595.1.p1 GENE.GHVU01102595.1~~GHVU01102595.1.p1  ORF type:complete len:1383 (-),score=282.50 GHVU01102595.1:1157-5305(-)